MQLPEAGPEIPRANNNEGGPTPPPPPKPPNPPPNPPDPEGESRSCYFEVGSRSLGAGTPRTAQSLVSIATPASAAPAMGSVATAEDEASVASGYPGWLTA